VSAVFKDYNMNLLAFLTNPLQGQKFRPTAQNRGLSDFWV